MKRKSTTKRSRKEKPAQEQNQLDFPSAQSSFAEEEITLKRSIFEKFGIDRVSYSIAAILIFLSGIYFGARFLPADTPPDSYYPIRIKPNSIKKNSFHKRSTVSSFSDPEDFFPAAEFRKQAAILIGCQNNLNYAPKLYTDIAKAVEGRVPLLGIVPTELQAQEGTDIMRQNGLPPDAMRYSIDHLEIDPLIKANFSFAEYESGHMMYLNSPDLKKIGQDVAEFLHARNEDN